MPTYTFEPLDYLIKSTVEALPKGCRGLEDNFEYHEWQTAYGDITPGGMPTALWKKNKKHWKDGATANHPEYQAYFDSFVSLTRRPTRMLPYYVCKHCHAVSDSFINNPDPKRAR